MKNWKRITFLFAGLFFLVVIPYGCSKQKTLPSNTGIPLIFFSSTQRSSEELSTTLSAYRGIWKPEQGIIELSPSPSFLLTAGGTVGVGDLFVCWGGENREIGFYNDPSATEKVTIKKLNGDFNILPSKIKISPESPPLLYYADRDEEYLVFNRYLSGNRIVVLSRLGKMTEEKTYTAPGLKEREEAVPVLLHKKDRKIELLVLVGTGGSQQQNKPYRLTITGGKATWTPVRFRDPHLAWIATMAGPGIDAAVIRSRVYISAPDGEVVSFDLTEKSPVLSPVEEIIRELKPAIQADPGEGPSLTHWGVYNGYLLGSTATGGIINERGRATPVTQRLWAFKDSALAGKMTAGLNDGKIRVYVSGRKSEIEQVLPGLTGVLLPKVGYISIK